VSVSSTPRATASNACLRPLQADDVNALATFLPQLLHGDWSARKLRELMQSTSRLRVLCTGTGTGTCVTGFAEYQQVLDEGHLLALAVAPRWQGRGLGKALLAAVLAEMQGSGCRRCLLEVRRSNTAAQGLYQSAGFELDGVRTAYYAGLGPDQPSEDALLYSLSLGSS
jgi:ribosomal-protein-alanine N-acetyltransferase